MSLLASLFNVPTADDAEKTHVIGREFFAALQPIAGNRKGTFESVPRRGSARLVVNTEGLTNDERTSLQKAADAISRKHGGYRVEIEFGKP